MEKAKPGPLIHLVSGSVWRPGAATLLHDPLPVSAMVGECIEGLELVCGRGRGGRGGGEEEGRT